MMDETSVANKVFEKCSRIFHDDDDYEKQFWSYLTTRATFHCALQKYSVSDPEKKNYKRQIKRLNEETICLVGPPK